MLLFDVDLFKKINDAYGHDIGDKCLQEIIHRTRNELRESDFIARYGGEEFIALLPEIEIDAAMEVAEKLRQVVENIEFIKE